MNVYRKSAKKGEEKRQLKGADWMKKRKVAVALCIILALSWNFALLAVADDVSRMTKEQLRLMIGNPDLRIIDVRSNVDWAGSRLKIKGAFRENPREVRSWMSKYSRDKTLVFYCA